MNGIIKDVLKEMKITKETGMAFYFESPGNKIEYYQGFETLDKKRAIQNDSNFRLASVSKQMIGYGIINLIEKKKLNYHTKLSQIFENLPTYMKEITIRQLLNHTSGLYELEKIPRKEQQLKDTEVFEFLCNQTKGYFEAGERYCYNNSGYIVLGLIIEKISKIPIEQYMKQTIFDPLHMNHTIVNRQGFTTIKNRVYGTKLIKNEFITYDQNFESATIGDGGIYSSIEDLKKWISFIETKRNLYQNGSMVETGEYYASGLKINKIHNYNIYYHCGETIGTNTAICFIPKKQIKFILLINCDKIDTKTFINYITQFIIEKKL